jgi:anaerobic selenocysteine-containing dehydrogenase
VHEQFMTETAELADIVLPATMFVEHDDIYRGGGQSHILLGPKLVDAPPLVRTNLFVIEELAKRLGVADRPGFGKTEREHIEHMLAVSGKPDFDTLAEDKWRSTASRPSRTRIISRALRIRMASSASNRIGKGHPPRTSRRQGSARSAP